MWKLVHIFYKELQKRKSFTAVELEHQFATAIFLQEMTGFQFDNDAAYKLLQKLTKKRLDLEEKLQKYFRQYKKIWASSFQLEIIKPLLCKRSSHNMGRKLLISNLNVIILLIVEG